MNNNLQKMNFVGKEKFSLPPSTLIKAKPLPDPEPYYMLLLEQADFTQDHFGICAAERKTKVIFYIKGDKPRICFYHLTFDFSNRLSLSKEFEIYIPL